MTSTLKADKIEGVTASGTVQMPEGSVIQVVQATTSTQTLHNSTTYSDTGLTVTITPKFSASKVLIMAKQKGVRLEDTDGSGCSIGLLRGTNFIHKPGPSTGHHQFFTSASHMYGELEVTLLDDPSTTSATTYKTQCASYYSSKNVYCQQGNNFTSVIIAMEIAQ